MINFNGSSGVCLFLRLLTYHSAYSRSSCRYGLGWILYNMGLMDAVVLDALYPQSDNVRLHRHAMTCLTPIKGLTIGWM